MTSMRSRTLGWMALLLLLGAVALKLWLVSGQTRPAFGDALDDDFHYLWMGANIAHGNWLGDFDQRTLMTGPGYPLWIALNSLHPVPLYLAEHLLYAVACLVFVLAVRPRFGAVAAALVFLLLLLNPVSYDAQVRRYLRDAIYYSETLLVVGCLLGLLLRARAGALRQAGWGAALGAALGCFWITKEEGLWIVPAVGAVLAALAFRVLAERPGRRRAPRVAVLLLPVLVATAVVGAVSVVNLRHYGVFGLTELHLAEFERAVGALQRVRVERPLRYVPVPREALEKITRVSPALGSLGPLDLHGGWSAAGRGNLGLMDDPRYEGEIMGGWFVWAFRAAVARAGHYASGEQALRFYRLVAEEIDLACEGQRLDCGRPRRSLAPPWRTEYLRPMLRALRAGLAQMTGLGGYHLAGWPSTGEPRRLDLIRKLTRDRLAPADRVEDGAEDRRTAALQLIVRLYRAILPAASVVAVLVWLLGWSVAPLRRRSAFLVAGGVLLLAVLLRLALLAYVDATSFRAMILRYLAPSIPLLLAFCGLMATELAGWLLPGRGRPPAATAAIEHAGLRTPGRRASRTPPDGG